MLRACPVTMGEHSCQRLSLGLRQGLNNILGASLSDLQWSQCTLPVRLGGLGIRDPGVERSAARISGILDFLQKAVTHLGLATSADILPPDTPQVLLCMKKVEKGVPFLAKCTADPTLLLSNSPLESSQKWWQKSATRLTRYSWHHPYLEMMRCVFRANAARMRSLGLLYSHHRTCGPFYRQWNSGASCAGYWGSTSPAVDRDYRPQERPPSIDHWMQPPHLTHREPNPVQNVGQS